MLISPHLECLSLLLVEVGVQLQRAAAAAARRFQVRLEGRELRLVQVAVAQAQRHKAEEPQRKLAQTARQERRTPQGKYNVETREPSEVAAILTPGTGMKQR